MVNGNRKGINRVCINCNCIYYIEFEFFKSTLLPFLLFPLLSLLQGRQRLFFITKTTAAKARGNMATRTKNPILQPLSHFSLENILLIAIT